MSTVCGYLYVGWVQSVTKRAQAELRSVDLRVGAPGEGFESRIRCVEYAVNPALESAYGHKKEEMTRRLGREGVNERLLFHGTSLANSEAILQQNFCLDKVGAEGRVSTPCTVPLPQPTGRSAI